MNPILRGAILMIIAAISISIDTIIIRIVSAEVHPFEIGFFRNLFSLVVLAPWLVRNGLRGLRSPRIPLHWARAVLKLAAIICFFYAVKLLPLASVTAIAFTTPLFVALGSMLLLGEPALKRRVLAVFAGFVGVLIVIRPGAAVFTPDVFVALAAAVGLAGVGMMMKYLSVRESPPAIVSLNLLMTAPIALVIMLPVWTVPGPEIFGLLVVQGLLGGLSQLSFSRAMSMADASVLIQLDFLRLPLVVMLAAIFFGEPADVWTLVGGTVIFGATVALVGRERRVSEAGAGVPS
jgi:drug/metabolite transporter (DMT)-like permease